MRLAKQREVWPIHRKKVIDRNCPRGRPGPGLTGQRLHISCFKYVQRHDIQKLKVSVRTMSHLVDNSNKGTDTGLSCVSEQAEAGLANLEVRPWGSSGLRGRQEKSKPMSEEE